MRPPTSLTEHAPWLLLLTQQLCTLNKSILLRVCASLQELTGTGPACELVGFHYHGPA